MGFPAPQCNQPGCSHTFRKRKMFKVHLKEHEVSPMFRLVQSNPAQASQSQTRHLIFSRLHLNSH